MINDFTILLLIIGAIGLILMAWFSYKGLFSDKKQSSEDKK